MNTFIKQLLKIFIILLVCNSSLALGFSSNGAECPDKFIGTVKKVSHPGPIVDASRWVEVQFEAHQKIKGNIGEAPSIRILKFGPFKFIEGEEYTVSLRNGFLCTAELSQ